MGDLGETELRHMQSLAQQVTTLRPELVNGDTSVGELAWVWAKNVDTLGDHWRHRFWHVDGQPVAWGWVRLPHRAAAADLTWQVHPDRPELLTEILTWYDEVAGDADRKLTLQSADAEAATIAATHGYVTESDDGSWTPWNARNLTDLPDPALPQGFRFRDATDLPSADLVEAHRNAWPRSRLTEAAFDRVRRTWPYRDDLHVLVEAPDGTLAATAIVWLDDVSRTAEFEPVGTHREFRRRGLGTAMQLHGMRLARAAGATRMLVACHGSPARPAALNMYLGVGFRELSRDLPYVKAQ